MTKILANIFIVIIIIIYSDILPKDIGSFLPNILTVNEVVEINKPNENYINDTKNIAKEILEKTDTKDAVSLAVFNDEFATKLDSYKNTNVESKYIVNLYTSSYKKAFGADVNFSSSDAVSDYINQNILSKEKFMTDEELDSLKEFFRGIAWNLIVKE